MQILPRGKDIDSYAMVDKAIGVIKESGIKHMVCPFETVMEGSYEEIHKLIERVQDACYEAGSEEMMVYLKIQSRKNRDTTINDKMEKYG